VSALLVGQLRTTARKAELCGILREGKESRGSPREWPSDRPHLRKGEAGQGCAQARAGRSVRSGEFLPSYAVGTLNFIITDHQKETYSLSILKLRFVNNTGWSFRKSGSYCYSIQTS
ncbi:unnamed protein product, partial [Bubo scandiacus]